MGVLLSFLGDRLSQVGWWLLSMVLPNLALIYLVLDQFGRSQLFERPNLQLSHSGLDALVVVLSCEHVIGRQPDCCYLPACI